MRTTILKCLLAGLAIAGAAGLITYNGHAGLGSNARTAAVSDGTSNTVMFAELAARPPASNGLILMADNGGQLYAAAPR